MDKLLLTPEETADVLGVGRSKVYELLYAGAIRSVKIGRARRVLAESVRAYVAALVEDAA